jgi:quercetin dioxygenase-like cupin family protein
MRMQNLVEDPVRRQRYGFSREGEVLRVELWADPGGEVPVHVHPSQQERYEIRAGEFRITVDGESRLATAGDRLIAPAGSWHRFENVGEGEAHMLVEVEPAGDLQAFLERAAELARAGKYTRRGVPRGLRAALELAVFADDFRDTTVLRWPPPAMQRPLAKLGRRLGYGQSRVIADSA